MNKIGNINRDRKQKETRNSGAEKYNNEMKNSLEELKAVLSRQKRISKHEYRKMKYTHTMEYDSLGKGYSDICYNIDKPSGHDAEWNKPVI